MVSVFKPRKSILSSPASSTTELSNWVTKKSESFALVIGTNSEISLGVIITPHAWIPVFLKEPSKRLACFRVCADKSLELYNFFNSLTLLNSSVLSSDFNSASFFEKISPNFIFGTSLEILSTSDNDRSSTLPVSLIDDLAAILPYVIIWATCWEPYLLTTYSITLFLPSSSKSISISGKLTLSGFKNLSKRRLYFIGSILVIPRAYATTEPAADPLPGPTDTPISLAALIKSWTIKKYPG